MEYFCVYLLGLEFKNALINRNVSSFVYKFSSELVSPSFV